MKLSLFDRIKLTLNIWRGTTYTPVVLANGVIIDPMNQTVVFPGDYHIHAVGNLRLSSEQHVMITSGQVPEERPGYLYSIWMNSQVDEQGRPVKEHLPMVFDAEVASDHDGIPVKEVTDDHKH